jgi:cold shock CspA family protein
MLSARLNQTARIAGKHEKARPKRLSPHPTNRQEAFMTRIGQIKIYNPETGYGVVQADDDFGLVLFFRRPCVVTPYSPQVGDPVCFQVRTSPISGAPEACRITRRTKAAA